MSSGTVLSDQIGMETQGREMENVCGEMWQLITYADMHGPGGGVKMEYGIVAMECESGKNGKRLAFKQNIYTFSFLVLESKAILSLVGIYGRQLLLIC